MISSSESIDDYMIYSLPLEESRTINDDEWEDTERPEVASSKMKKMRKFTLPLPEVASSKMKKMRKFTLPLAFAFVVIGAVAGAVLSRSSNSIKGIHMEQMQSTNDDEGPGVPSNPQKQQSSLVVSDAVVSKYEEEIRSLESENQTLQAKYSELEHSSATIEMTLQTVESERDFYFEKLRGIEVMLQVYKEKEEEKVGSGNIGSVIDGIFKVMYATMDDNTHETTKSSKSSKSGRGSMGGETIGSDWESESISMSFYFRDINTFMSMSAPSIALDESMRFPSIEIASMSLPSVESMSLSLSSIESLLLSLPTIDSISLSLPSIEIESVSLIENAFVLQGEYELRPDGVGSMSLPSVESLSLSLPSIESISLSLPSIEINSLSLNGNSFNVHKKIGSRPNRVGTKGSKRDTSDIRDINTFMSMSAPSIALDESMSFPSIEIASMSLPSVESMSLSLSSIESLPLSLPTIDSISLSLPSIEIESVSLIENAFVLQDEFELRPDGVGSMSLPSIESLSLSLPSIESISLSLPSIEINSLSLNDDSFNSHEKNGSRPNRVGTKGSKRKSDVIAEENPGSLSLSMPSATRFLEFDEYDETDSIHTQFNTVHDGPVFRRKRMEIIFSN